MSFDQLYSIDPVTAIATDIGSLGESDIVALASDQSGVLYGSGSSAAALVRIDRVSGAATLIGNLGGGLIPDGDLAFAPDGRLFGTFRTSTGATVLATASPTTGAVTQVNPGMSVGYQNVWGLAFAGGRLFGLTTDAIGQGTLIQLDLVTGRGSFIRSLTFNASGAAVRRLPD